MCKLKEEFLDKIAEDFSYDFFLVRTSRDDCWERTPEQAKELEKEMKKLYKRTFKRHLEQYLKLKEAKQ